LSNNTAADEANQDSNRTSTQRSEMISKLAITQVQQQKQCVPSPNFSLVFGKFVMEQRF